jgi:hypothetical protein
MVLLKVKSQQAENYDFQSADQGLPSLAQE